MKSNSSFLTVKNVRILNSVSTLGGAALFVLVTFMLRSHGIRGANSLLLQMIILGMPLALISSRAAKCRSEINKSFAEHNLRNTGDFIQNIRLAYPISEVYLSDRMKNYIRSQLIMGAFFGYFLAWMLTVPVIAFGREV